MNIFKLIKEDIEDIVLIHKCAFRALGDTNPITQVTRIRDDRLKRKEAELAENLRESLKLDHEPGEIEESMKTAYSEFIRQKAEVLLYDFEKPSYESPEYVEYYRKKLENGEIEKAEYQFERAHHKMHFSNWFFCRTVSYGIMLLFVIPVAITLLVRALMT